MQEMKRTTWNRGTPWVMAVLLLGFPSLLFVILHALYAPGSLPEFFDLVVVWSMTGAGMVGTLFTLAACVVAMIAMLQRHVPGKTKAAMWAFVLLSFLACLYLAKAPA